MPGYMVTTQVNESKEFYMVNSEDPDRACEEVLHCSSGREAHALTPLSDETLDHYKVKPNEPWLCFRASAQPGANIGEGWGISQTAFGDNALEEVGRVELRMT